MNRKQTLAAIQAMGMSARYKDGEYRVAPGYILAGGRGFQDQQAKEAEAKAYYTNDREDALDTARAMVASRSHRLPGHFAGYTDSPERATFTAQVHRFRESVAGHVGTGETVYMTPADARKLARALIAAAKSCETEGFAASTFRTATFLFIDGRASS